MRVGLLLAVCMTWLPALALAQAVALQQDGRAVQADHKLRDREFGVSTRHVGLQRQVQMYQWQRAGDGYVRAWSAQSIDSSGFAPGHANPGEFPVQTRYWMAGQLTMDGKPVDDEVLKTLGQWRQFRPNFSRLPANLAATFQPEGDGLGSAEDPLEPRVGDLRVIWRQLVLGDLAGKLELRNERWFPVAASGLAAASDSAVAPALRTHWFRIVMLLTAALAVLVGLIAGAMRLLRGRRGGR